MKITRMVSRIAAAALFLAAGSLFGQNLTLGSWRTDDVAKISNIIAAFNKTYPNIKVKFDPTNPPDYNATLRLQLESGNGPDLFYARSYATGAELYKAGFELDLTSLPAIKSNFTPSAVSAWTTPDGKIFAMPLGAVSHGIYYNTEIFAKNGIAVPKTWEDFNAVMDRIRDLLALGRPANLTLEAMAEEALARGGRDNLTGLLLTLDDPNRGLLADVDGAGFLIGGEGVFLQKK